MEFRVADLVLAVPDGAELEVIAALGAAGSQLDPYADRTLPAASLNEARANVLATHGARLDAVRQSVARELRRRDIPPWAEPLVVARAAEDPMIDALARLADLLARAAERGAEVLVLGR